jgi:peptidoglycan-associated lipoprotein
VTSIKLFNHQIHVNEGKAMKINAFNQAIALLFSIVLLSGCESTTTKPADETVASTDASSQGAGSGSGMSESGMGGGDASQADAALREVRTFYFDFDQYTLKAEAQAPLAAHAAFLAANPSAKIRIEGHCDERGTTEYNMALGERRAKAVERFLTINGVSAGQLEVVSYGEERPVDAGHDESAWAKNRRAYIEYL